MIGNMERCNATVGPVPYCKGSNINELYGMEAEEGK